MAGIGSVVIQFIGKDKLSKVAGKVGDAVDDVGHKSSGATKKFGGLSAAWAASIPIAGAVVAAGVGLVNFMVDAGKAALEDKNSADKLAHTLSRVKGVTEDAIDANEDWITSMQLATLVSDTDLRKAVGKLTTATGSLTRAQELTTIALDASAASGKSLDTITTALSKAENGNTAALQKLYPWLDKNKDGTLTLKEATDGLKNAYKGAAGEATKTRPWEVLATLWGELKESLGQWLLPLMEKFSDWFKNKTNQQKIQDFLEKVGDLSYQLGTKLLYAFTAMYNWLKKPENQRKIQSWIDAMRDFAHWIGQVISAVQLMITWLGKIKIPKMPAWLGGGAFAPGASGATQAAASRAPAPATVYEPTVIVTEEQVYRAVQRLIMRGDARNGRLVVAR